MVVVLEVRVQFQEVQVDNVNFSPVTFAASSVNLNASCTRTHILKCSSECVLDLRIAAEVFINCF